MTRSVLFAAALTRGLTALALITMLAGCSGGASAPPTSPAASGQGPSEPAPSASGPAADAIRKLDPASLRWKWFENHSQSLAIDLAEPDKYGRSYTLGEPVYSDADGDGLEDMAVSVAQRDGNGYREHWHIWLASADGGAEQVRIPIALTARCGDATSKVSAVKGGFRVKELLREPIIDDRVPCAKPGTFASTRNVGVERVGKAHALVNLKDRRGYGGVCPTQPRTETGRVKVWGSLVPANGTPLTIDGDRMYLIWTHPHPLTAGAEPMRLAAVWPAGGNSDNRICVWTDPGRYENA